MKYRESETDKKLRSWFTNDMTKGLLRKIKLTEGNLRGVTPFELSFDYPITAIAGKNGAGKSTLLAMASCAFHNGKKGFKLRKRRQPYYTFSDFFIQHTEEVPPQGVEMFYQIAHDNWRKSEQNPESKGLKWQKRWKRQGGKWNDYALRVPSDVVFLGIDRIVPHSERSQSKSYSKAFKDSKPQGWEKEVADLVGYVLGKKYEVLRYLEHGKYDLPIVESGGHKYSGLNMGAGENALFEIFRVIFSCGEGALIVIDEIELGLHVDAQRKLVRKLKDVCLEHKIQIICTTHSKEIFANIPPEARKFIECISGQTIVTEGISPDFAMAKMGASELKELDLLIEDGVAEDILKFCLPARIRQRVRIRRIGSASALSRQLSAIYMRNDERPVLAIFDGDQKVLASDNLKHSKAMIENSDERFDEWFYSKVDYIPGEVWPELWLIQESTSHVETLAELLTVDSGSLLDYMEYAKQAGKHNEFHELSKHLGLEKDECIQYFVTNLKSKEPSLFSSLVQRIEHTLESY